MILCSIYSWAVIIEKFRLFKKINKSSEEFEEKFWNQNLLKIFIIVYQQTLKIQWHLVFQRAMQGLLKKKSKTNLSERMIAMLEAGVRKTNDKN